MRLNNQTRGIRKRVKETKKQRCVKLSTMYLDIPIEY